MIYQFLSFFNRNRHSQSEADISLTLTEREVHNLVWLWYSQVQMNKLLGHLADPLDKIGFRFAPMVYSHHHEYQWQYQQTLPLIERALEQFAEKPNADLEELNRLIKLTKSIE